MRWRGDEEPGRTCSSIVDWPLTDWIAWFSRRPRSCNTIALLCCGTALMRESSRVASSTRSTWSQNQINILPTGGPVSIDKWTATLSLSSPDEKNISRSDFDEWECFCASSFHRRTLPAVAARSAAASRASGFPPATGSKALAVPP